MYNRYILDSGSCDFQPCFEEKVQQCRESSPGFSVLPKNILSVLRSILPEKLDTSDLILILILVLLFLEDEDEELLIILLIMLLG